MRWLAIAVLVTGCTRSNDAQQCVPGIQTSCACPGGVQGAQACNVDGTGYDACQCPGGNDLAMGPCAPDCVNQDLSVGDLAGQDLAASGGDLASNEDLSMMSLYDFAQLPPDLSGVDLIGVDLTAPPPPDFSVPGVQCAVVMIVQDTTGSMGADFTNGSSTPTKLQASETAVNKMVMDYGWRVPFGLTNFDTGLSGTGTCTDGINIDVEPKLGSSMPIEQLETTFQPGGGTNSGDAIVKIAADPNMHDASRQGSFAILITDGAPNCNATEPATCVSQISAANSGSTPLKTFVIGLGAIGSGIIQSDADALDQMAAAGGVPCTGGFCQKHKFFPAESPQMLAMALDLIMQQIVMSAPGGTCGNFTCFPSGGICSGSTATCCGSAGCKDVLNDANNCGSCDNVCGGSTCSNGKCVCGNSTCPSGDRCCGTVCCSSLDMAQPIQDLAQPPPVDMAGQKPLCSCVANFNCLLMPGHCIADNCCDLDGTGCTATPTLCTAN